LLGHCSTEYKSRAFIADSVEILNEDIDDGLDVDEIDCDDDNVDSDCGDSDDNTDDGVADVIVELLDDAQESIYFMAFSFTSDDISGAIQNRARNGATVAGRGNGKWVNPL